MNKVLLPLDYSQAHKLDELIKQTIETNLWQHQTQIKAFEASELHTKEKLSEYIMVNALDGKYCQPFIIKDLPEWLNEFLLNCYVLAHNHLASQQS